ncbi:putative peroxidase 26 [Acorus gramineus]|uniref:Peroxidase n=1 Tax=Acorus gramineus TaxID=55184 RepID=A0AAV9B1P8_ACOGR|nr:putative peroxidase 26 [Acorus gramineus]
MEGTTAASFLLLFFVLLHSHNPGVLVHGGVAPPRGPLVIHYYNHTCRYAEEFVKHQVTLAWNADPSITAALLRLLYTDCFVSGCDASILLDGEESEKKAPQNTGLKGFDVIDRIKRVLEARCPGVVSCADILNLAARDAVALAGAPKYPVFTGRRDGMHSTARSVDLPPASITWNGALAYFKSRGLNFLDLGTLLGAHSLGITHCVHIRDRLYNFNGTRRPDPTMSNSTLKQLRKQCPQKIKPGQPDPTVFLNLHSGKNYTFENYYYSQALHRQAVLGIDQKLTSTMDGVRISQEFADEFEDLRRTFALSMSRMGNIGVLTGNQGEIRKNCRFTNV